MGKSPLFQNNLQDDAVEALNTAVSENNPLEIHRELTKAAKFLGLRVGDDLIPIGLRPHPVTSTQMNWLTRCVYHVFNAVLKIEKALYEGDPVLKALLRRAIPDERDRRLFYIHSARRLKGRRFQMGRADVLSKLLEINANGVQGFAYYDMLAKIYETVLPRHIPELRGLEIKKIIPSLKSVLLSAFYAEHPWVSRTPVVGIVMLRGKDLVERNEIPYIQEQFIRAGLRTIVGYHNEVSIKDGISPQMFIRGERIEILYRAFDVAQVGDEWDNAPDLYHILSRPQDFVVVPEVADAAAGLKLTFALLRSPLWSGRFTPEEKRAIREIVPFTWVVSALNPASVLYPIINKRKTVLKTSYGSSGNEVTIGSKTPWAEWLASVFGASIEHDSVIQAKDPHPGFEWPIVDPLNGTWDFERRLTDVGPHLMINSDLGMVTTGTAVVRFGSSLGHPINVGQQALHRRGGVSLVVNADWVVRVLDRYLPNVLA